MLPTEVLEDWRWQRVDVITLPQTSRITLKPIDGIVAAPIMAIAITAPNSDPTWSRGGYITASIPLALGSFDRLVFGEFKAVLNATTLIKHPISPAPQNPVIHWRLSFPRWIDSAQVEIFSLNF